MSGIPLFFKLWFGFIALVVVSVFALVVFIGIEAASVASDPEAMGNYVGEVVKGFNEATE